jgi:hypothetical protein
MLTEIDFLDGLSHAANDSFEYSDANHDRPNHAIQRGNLKGILVSVATLRGRI